MSADTKAMILWTMIGVVLMVAVFIAARTELATVTL